MKKLVLIIVSLLCAFALFGCSKADPPYNGYVGKEQLEIDDGITLDGTLDDDIWTKAVKTTIDGAKIDDENKRPINIEKYGERSAEVYTYIGQKAVYFAFDVKDKNLYYNKLRAPGQNTSVELYFAGITQSGFSDGCYSIRVSPTGENNGTGYYLAFYDVRTILDKNDVYQTNWVRTKKDNRYSVAVKVNGKVKNSLLDVDYDTANNVGYTVEIAFDLELLDENKDALLYTTAFCQARDFELNRLANTFYKGVYNNPLGWEIITNDGIVADKTKFVDSKVVADDGFKADGRFDEAVWDGTEGRTFSTGKTVTGKTEEIKYTFYSNTTDKGVYIGVESNDSDVRYDKNRREQYSTGAEISLTVNGETVIEPKYTLQYRFNVGGEGKRHRGQRVTDSSYAYGTALYYPALAGGRAIDGNVNAGNATGWAGEIFIPWSSFGGEVTDKSSVAIMVNGYQAVDSTATRNSYLTPVNGDVCSNGGPDMNPQEKWFVFKNGKPVYEPIRIQSLTLDGNDLNGDFYEATIEAKYHDTVVVKYGYKEEFPVIKNGEFDFGVSGATAVDNGDGSYTIKIPASTAGEFAEPKEVSFTADGIEETFKILIDEDFTLDGTLNDNVWTGIRKITTTQTTTGHTATNSFALTLGENAIYVGATIVDAKYTSFKDSKPLGLELYFHFGGELAFENTYGVKILSNTSLGQVYRYNKYLDETTAWAWDAIFTEYDEIESVFNGTSSVYTVEAKIPYSVFGRVEKPDYLAVAPFTKFIKNNDGEVSTKLIKWEGDPWVVTLDLYQQFTENGFTPDKCVLSDSFGDRVSEISLLKDQTENNNYKGEFYLSLYPDKEIPITDADFGAKASLFTNNGNGKYSFSIPKTEFGANNELEFNFESPSYDFDGKVKIALKGVTEIYSSFNDINAYALEPTNNNYNIKIRLFADEAHKLPLTGVTFGSGTTAVDNGDGSYNVTIPASSVQTGAYSLAMKYTGSTVVERSIKIHYLEWSSAEKAKAKTYLNFNGKVEDGAGGDTQLTIVGNPVYTNRIGTNDAMKMIVKPKGTPNDGVDVSETLGAGSFSISFDFKAYSVAFNENNSQYEFISSGNLDPYPAGENAFQMSFNTRTADGPGFRIQLGEHGQYFPVIANAKDVWHTAVFVVERSPSSSKATGTLYIDGEVLAKKDYNITSASIGDGIIHLGGADWKYTTTMAKPFEMDNFLLYDGILTEKQVADISLSTKMLK